MFRYFGATCPAGNAWAGRLQTLYAFCSFFRILHWKAVGLNGEKREKCGAPLLYSEKNIRELRKWCAINTAAQVISQVLRWGSGGSLTSVQRCFVAGNTSRWENFSAITCFFSVTHCDEEKTVGKQTLAIHPWGSDKCYFSEWFEWPGEKTGRFFRVDNHIWKNMVEENLI